MKALRKPLSLFMALLMCLGVFVGTGTTAFAAGETMTTYMIDLPRASDPNKAGWGHPALNFLGGWSTGENDSFYRPHPGRLQWQGHLLYRAGRRRAYRRPVYGPGRRFLG